LDFDSKRKVSFVSGSGHLYQILSKSVKHCDRESTDRHIHTHPDRQTHKDHTGDLIICPMLCYSNGTDNKTVSKLGSYRPNLARYELGGGFDRPIWRRPYHYDRSHRTTRERQTNVRFIVRIHMHTVHNFITRNSQAQLESAVRTAFRHVQSVTVSRRLLFQYY